MTSAGRVGSPDSLVKIILEVLLSIFLHPVAVVLAWLNLAVRGDMGTLGKLIWAVVLFFAWGIGPIVYILFGGGTLW